MVFGGAKRKVKKERKSNIVGSGVKELYRERFDAKQIEQKGKLWKVLCGYFFQQFVAENAIVVDLGAGYCEFINNICAARKIAVDLNEDTKNFAGQGVEVYISSATTLSFLLDNSVDVVFMSNLLEHMRSKNEVFKVLLETHRLLKQGGTLLILQPNIRYAYKEYWGFFDHHVPLSDKSLVEALKIAGFEIRKVIPAFLPYTTKSKLPQWDILVKVYLKLPFAWRLIGKQMFVEGRKK